MATAPGGARRGRPTRSGRTPPVLVVIAVAVGLEVLVLLGVVVVYGIDLTSSGATDLTGAVATAALAAAAAVGLGLCARGLLAGRRWARAPVLTWQLLQVLVAYPLLGQARGSALWWGAAGLVALSTVAAVGLFVPAVVRATTQEQEPPVT